MKKLLLFSILIVLSTTLFSQTKTWVGPSGGAFSEATFWNPSGVPSSTNDVIIPTGSNMSINGANIRSIAIQGNAVVAMTSNITFTEASSIASNAVLNCISGTFFGSGTLTNNGTGNFNQESGIIANSVTIINHGIFNLNTNGINFAGNGSPILNNMADGIINLIGQTGSIQGSSGQGTIINSGLINRKQGTGVFGINIPLKNNNGTIIVENGTLQIQNALTEFNSGTFNVMTGSVLEWNSSFTCTGTLTGQLDGDLNWTGTLIVAPGTEAILDFTEPSGISWVSGNFNGDGTLTNIGVLNFETNTTRAIGGASTLNNEGTININSTGIQLIGYGSPIFNNLSNGILNLNAESGSIQGASGQGTIINTGLIRRTQGTGNYGINIPLENNGGTLLAENGVLQIQNALTEFNGGIYNVNAGAVLEWNSTFTCSGTLSGQIDGALNWTGTLTVATGTEAILDFTEPSGLSWVSGGFSGNGTLTNTGLLNLVSANGKSIVGQSNLNNEGIINYNGAGALTLGGGSPTLTNATTGVINLNIDSSFTFASGIGTVVNSGLIIKEQTSGTFIMSTNNNNMSPGKIISENGLISFGNYMGNGTIGGNASVRFQGGTVFEGTIAPGSSPGTLTLDSSYNSTSATILAIELNGPNAGTQYDVFAVQSSAIFNGIVNVTLGFAPILNNEFVVATTSGTIAQCNLATTTSADFNGMTYIFDVFCRNNNQVVLKLVNVTLEVDDLEMSESSIQLYPNPLKNILYIKNINNLELENGSIMDMTGKVISTFDLRNTGLTKEVSLENISSGMYFIKINGVNNSITKRIVKQ